MLKLYNTLSRKKEVFKPIKKGKVSMYSCGPTVYDYDHVGHAWKYTVDDLLRRVLEYNGFSVNHVMNITDVGHLTSDADEGEDKIEKKAREEGKSAWDISKYYTKIFLKNREKLNQLKPSILCRATDHIPEMIDLVQKIWDRGSAYKISDGVYFDVSKFPEYGKLSGNTLENLKAGARVKINPEKKHPADFALWKFSPKDKKRQMEWDSPWGKGFPGWHIECSAMSIKYLGNHIDIHTGGEDNIFPHHESEIAQSETATGEKFVNFWVHTRFLNIEGKKMSKSLGNFFRIQDLEEKGIDPLAFRYLCLIAHYRSQLNFTWEGLKAASNSLKNLRSFVIEIKPSQNQKKSVDNNEEIKAYRTRFLETINNDLNIPEAIALMWGLIKDKELNAFQKYTLLIDFDRVFGLGLDKIKEEKIPGTVKKLLKLREEYRKEGQWKKADEIRKQIEDLNYIIKDTKSGPKAMKR